MSGGRRTPCGGSCTVRRAPVWACEVADVRVPSRVAHGVASSVDEAREHAHERFGRAWPDVAVVTEVIYLDTPAGWVPVE